MKLRLSLLAALTAVAMAGQELLVMATAPQVPLTLVPITVGAVNRSYHVAVPSACVIGPCDLVFFFHAIGSSDEGTAALTELETYGHSAIVIYMQGITCSAVTHWNAGDGETCAATNNHNDLEYYDAVLADVCNTYPCGEAIHVAGIARGGMMAAEVARKRTDVATLAMISGVIPAVLSGGQFGSQHLLWLHGENDTSVCFAVSCNGWPAGETTFIAWATTAADALNDVQLKIGTYGHGWQVAENMGDDLWEFWNAHENEGTSGPPASSPPPSSGSVPPPPLTVDFYVSPTGSGTTCSDAVPCSLATAQSQADAVAPHDVIGFKNGTYPGFASQKNWLYFYAINQHLAIIDGPEDDAGGDGASCIDNNAKSNNTFDGFEVRNCNRAGIVCHGEASITVTNCVIKNNEVHDAEHACVAATGIWVFNDGSPANTGGVDRMNGVTVLNNELYKCNYKNDGGGQGGGPCRTNESISMGNAATNIEIAYNLIYGPCQYGIDMKKGARNFEFHHNILEDHERHGFYIDSAGYYSEHGHIHDNLLREGTRIQSVPGYGADPAWGNRNLIAIARESGSNATIQDIVVENNLACDSGRQGILVYQHQGDTNPSAGIFRDLTFTNNILLRTGGETSHPSRVGIEVSHPFVENVLVNNNKIWATNGTPIRTPPETADVTFSNNETAASAPASGDPRWGQWESDCTVSWESQVGPQ